VDYLANGVCQRIRAGSGYNRGTIRGVQRLVFVAGILDAGRVLVLCFMTIIGPGLESALLRNCETNGSFVRYSCTVLLLFHSCTRQLEK
jgi:hypothetical protein